MPRRRPDRPAPEPNHAVTLAAESARIAAETGSARHRKELDALRAGMGKWKNDKIGAQFEQALRPITA
ncbi:hypothetical protein [Streptomyces sp. H27-D2]|uniref:hypothetical protein n=1 Tax=Streptomyces sp. H27-D2 TaxID=3046304 RepID=UPI002DBD4C2D|nr:hypothetical protein [Streptomyces sp. H27-D2]MEC4015072.1 hypothetical protein [Streptomyces sp. H27-D2]